MHNLKIKWVTHSVFPDFFSTVQTSLLANICPCIAAFVWVGGRLPHTATLVLFLMGGVNDRHNSCISTSWWQNALQWIMPVLSSACLLIHFVLYSVNVGYNSNFSSCNSYALLSTTVHGGFSHMSICSTQVHSAVCAIKL